MSGVILYLLLLLPAVFGASILLVTDCRSGSLLQGILSGDGHTVTTAYAAAGSASSGCYDVPVLQAALPYGMIAWESNGPSGDGDALCAATASALDTYVNNGGVVVVYGYDVIASPDDPVLISLLGGSSSFDTGGCSVALSSAVGAEFVTRGVVDIRGIGAQDPTCSGDRDTLNSPYQASVVPVWDGSSCSNGYYWSIYNRGAGKFVWMSTSCSGCTANGDSYWTAVPLGSQNYVYNPAIRNIASNVCTPSCVGKICGADDGCGGKCFIPCSSKVSFVPVPTSPISYDAGATFIFTVQVTFVNPAIGTPTGTVNIAEATTSTLTCQTILTPTAGTGVAQGSCSIVIPQGNWAFGATYSGDSVFVNSSTEVRLALQSKTIQTPGGSTTVINNVGTQINQDIPAGQNTFKINF